MDLNNILRYFVQSCFGGLLGSQLDVELVAELGPAPRSAPLRPPNSQERFTRMSPIRKKSAHFW
jgi:hypothetical protein